MSEVESIQTCKYTRADGSRCADPIESEGGEFCFWHDRDVDKEGPEVKQRLEERALSGESMEGFQLRFAHLEGVKLFSNDGFDLSKANLFRAHLQGAKMFNINLQEADLKKADLSGANLNESKMRGANILGTILQGARLERVDWGDDCVQEREARELQREGKRHEALVRFEEAEEIYRSLRQAYDSAGRFDNAGSFFRMEMTMRRMLLPPWSVGRVWSKIVDLFCAYGESPPRVIGFSVLINLLCAIAYFVMGIKSAEGPLRLDLQAGLADNVVAYLNCVYYSIVTFTTLGYGDITPTAGLLRALAAIQAFTGAFMMAMFVAVFGKKMTRG